MRKPVTGLLRSGRHSASRRGCPAAAASPPPSAGGGASPVAGAPSGALFAHLFATLHPVVAELVAPVLAGERPDLVLVVDADLVRRRLAAGPGIDLLLLDRSPPRALPFWPWRISYSILMTRLMSCASSLGEADDAAAGQVTGLVDRQRALQGQVGEHRLRDVGRLPGRRRPCRALRARRSSSSTYWKRLTRLMSPRTPRAARSVCSGRPDVPLRIFTATSKQRGVVGRVR